MSMKSKKLTSSGIKCMCGHVIISTEEVDAINARGDAEGWTFGQKLEELDRVMQINGDKFHKDDGDLTQTTEYLNDR